MAIVHVLDGDQSYRTAVERRLRAAGYDVVTYESARQLLRQIPDDDVEGCILLDVDIPDLSGPELQDRLRELGSTLPIVFLAVYADIPMTVRAIKAGAEDVLTKPVPEGQLLGAIETAITHHRATRERHHALETMRARVVTLTPREHQVFERVVRGRSNKEIARALGISERTIKAHRHRVMEKVRVQSLAELVSVAERVGILATASERADGAIEG